MFIYNRNTQIIYDWDISLPVKNAIQILNRDRDTVFYPADEVHGTVCLKKQPMDIPEQYKIQISEQKITIMAADDLGFVYGLLKLSENFLGIHPFWFWMDQKMVPVNQIEIKEQMILSPKMKVRFRGWFYNDEVLMMKWKYNEEDPFAGWKMAFETLLRCGGNMTIPGTDKMSIRNRKLASEMGLWITHHHAEPLGAEMFVRAYPGVEPNYLEKEEMFLRIWEEAVVEQKDYKVIWNLGFRGQGDAPFWLYDTSGRFTTPESQGQLISMLIEKQCSLVKKYVENPVFCVNLYGEVMELYEEGYIHLADDIIKVRADNGYGRMVTRRRDNHCVRLSSMPDKNDKGAQGIYYHVSFYDLQAANHITMLPNSVSFVNRELNQVLENGGNDFWIINCSNVRPHAYYLDAVSKKWAGRDMDDETQSKEFASLYYGGNAQIAQCYQRYPEAMIPYGENEDDHMGEQFYTENIRILAHQFLTNKNKGHESLMWIAGDGSLTEQKNRICALCSAGIEKLEKYYKHCLSVSENLEDNEKRLFDTTLLLQVSIHQLCAKGVEVFGRAWDEYETKNYEKAFVYFGNSAELFDKVNEKMREAEYGVWADFYKNDCFADVKHTAYMIRKIMGIIREWGDNVRHDKWYHEYCCPKGDAGVYLLLLTENHMTDWELYEIMKKTID